MRESSPTLRKPITNTLTVKPKTAKVKYKKLKKKKQTVARYKVMTVSNPQGKVTYKLTGVKRGKSKKFSSFVVGVTSAGPDGKFKSGDDITTWPKDIKK